MFSIFIVASTALAHTMLYSPAPKFREKGARNAPFLCSLIAFQSTSQPKNIGTFTSQLRAKYDGSLLKYFTACGSNSAKTVHIGEASIPTDGVAKIDARSQHPGLLEFYIDNLRVASGTWQTGQTPESVHIDYSKCRSGKCKFRYLMVAVHQQPMQLYDNIVTIVGPPGDSKQDAVSSRSLFKLPDKWQKCPSFKCSNESSCFFSAKLRMTALYLKNIGNQNKALEPIITQQE